MCHPLCQNFSQNSLFNKFMTYYHIAKPVIIPSFLLGMLVANIYFDITDLINGDISEPKYKIFTIVMLIIIIAIALLCVQELYNIIYKKRIIFYL
jgi:uncharacterized membrane protein